MTRCPGHFGHLEGLPDKKRSSHSLGCYDNAQLNETVAVRPEERRRTVFREPAAG